MIVTQKEHRNVFSVFSLCQSLCSFYNIMMFTGNKIKDEILADLKPKIASLPTKPTLAVVWIGDDPVSAKYIEIKKKVAKDLGIDAEVIKLSETISQAEAEKMIKNIKADGVVIQMPISKSLDRQRLIELIPAGKDVDGLRYCAELDSDYFPPVALAILEAVKNSGASLIESRVAIVGQGFLVGAPLAKVLKDQVADLRLADDKVKNLSELTVDADIVISATGHAGLIKPDMIKEGAVLIDAGTTEVGGELRGDIDPSAYAKSSFYTPVPGGIGPVTVAMLFRNLVASAKPYKELKTSTDITSQINTDKIHL